MRLHHGGRQSINTGMVAGSRELISSGVDMKQRGRPESRLIPSLSKPSP